MIHPLRSFLLAASAGVPLLAQELPSHRTFERVTPVHSLPDDEGLAYGLWAAGDDYKARFDDGVRFVPYLGRLHPQVESVRWRTQSIRRGAHELARPDARRSHTTHRVEFDHGGVVEAYDVLAGGLEQTFVLASAPAGEGDLVIRGAIDGTLCPLPPCAGAVPFADGRGVVVAQYGAAVAIDADGRRLPLSTGLVDGGIELRVDGGWLANAAFPVVVDPLLAATEISSGAEIEAVDVARDPGAVNPVYIAETRYAAAGDADLWLWRVNDTGTLAINVFADITGLWSTLEPSLGFDATTFRTLCAFTRDFAAAGTRRVRMHRHLRTDLVLDGTVLQLDSPDGRNRWRPAVGSDLAVGSAGSLLLVCQVESTGAFADVTTSEIHAVVVDLAGSGSITREFVVASAALTDHARPSIAAVAAGVDRVWSIAYQSYFSFALPGNNNEWQIRIARADDFGVLVAPFTVPAGSDQHDMAPQLAGIDDRLMVFYTESSSAEAGSKPAGANGHRIRGARLNGYPGGFSLPYGTRLLQANGDARLVIGDAAYDSATQSHWALLIRSTATENLYLRTYGYTGSEVSDELVDQPSVAIGTVVTGGLAARGSTGGFLCAYGVVEPGVGNEVRYTRRTWPALSKTITGAAACTPATIGWYGFSVLGSQFGGVRLENMPAGSFAGVFVSAQSVDLQLFGIGGMHDGCWLLVPINGPDAFGLLGPAIGPVADFPLALPEFVAPQTLHFQGVVFDPASGDLFSTQRLEVQVGS